MNIKTYLAENRIKQVELAKALELDPSTLSLFINAWKRFPEKHKTATCNFLGISKYKLEELLQENKNEKK